jgi:hypothetical protein
MTVTYCKGKAYLCFTLDHDADLAAARFEQKHGAHPEAILEHDGLLRVGPVPETRARNMVTTIDNLPNMCIMVTTKGEQ